MHHLYPLKGDPLCPLGFHPQVRWPTRCKRCFRDYKEHGGKKRESESNLRKDGSALSTPSLSWTTKDNESKNRTYYSTTNLAAEEVVNNGDQNSHPSSWISTPDLANLEDDSQPVTTVNIKLPVRKQKPIDTGQRTVSDSFSVVKDREKPVFNKTDSLATRARKLREIRESSPKERVKRIQVKEVKTISEEPTNHDVQFLIQVKTKSNKEPDISDRDDTASIAGTESTDTTLVDPYDSDMRDQLESLKKELDVTKQKCERLEREKGDMLLRRVAAMESTTSKTSASEVLKLQQKCNELQQQLEDYKDEKRSLSLKVKELEADLDLRPTASQTQKIADDLRSKLLAAETLCEELMDENEDIKKELRDMEEQMDELQDNFREDQAVEYTSLKKDLDQTTKNCRILSFQLRKAERKAAQLELDRTELEKKLKDIPGSGTTLNQIDRIKQLEQELKIANEVSMRLQKELDETKTKGNKTDDTKGSNKKKAPMLGSIGKSHSGDEKVSRESLTRGGSQEDPAQLLRDLQDSLEREADLREQLKFAEEEGENLRKKVSRIEDDNESLVLQLKKMATRARTRKLSPTNQKLGPEPSAKPETDDEDPAELKLQLELSEQEASVLRKKIEDLQSDNMKLKTKVKDLQDQISTRSVTKKTVIGTKSGKDNALLNEKIKVLEEETNDIRKKLIEKERDCERLHAELSITQKRSKGMQKSKSLELDQQALDLRRQLQVIEQEASVLRNKVQTLESENEKLNAENRRLTLLKSTKSAKADKNLDKYIDQIASLEVDLSERDAKIKELETKLLSGGNNLGLELKGDLKKFIQRTPKRVTALTSKDQLKNMVGDLEKEIEEILTAMKSNENAKIKLEEEVKSAIKDLEDLNKKYDSTKKDLEAEKSKAGKDIEELNRTLKKAKENLEKATKENLSLESQIDKMNNEKAKFASEKKDLDDEVSKLKANIKTLTNKQNETDNLKASLEIKEKEVKKLKEEKSKITSEISEKSKRISDLEAQLSLTNEGMKKLQEQIKTAESRLEKEKQKAKSLEADKTNWEEEKRKLASQIDSLHENVRGLENIIEQKDKLAKQLEIRLAKEKELLSKTSLKAEELESAEINRLKDELTRSKARVSDIESKLESSNKFQKTLEDKLTKAQNETKNAKLENEKKIKELEIDLQNERKKLDVAKNNQEKEQKNRELELSILRDKIRKLENNGGGTPEIKALQATIEKLEKIIASEKKKYSDLTAKYEILEEEHVVTKAKLVMEKETIESQFKTLKKEMTQIEGELRTLRDNYNVKQDTWIKEKLELETRFKEISKSSLKGGESDRQRLKALLEEKLSEFEQLKKEHDNIHDQMEYMRRENDELKKKLDDYDKVNKVQRNMSADSSAMEMEIKQLRMKLNNFEKNKKSDLAELKMRYESQLNAVNGELQSLQNQVMRFKREKDTYKHMLQTAQKTIGDLKQNPYSHKEGPKNYDELEESKSKVATLEQQISCMEDELSEARLECSRLKTELVSERSTWEVKLSELHSKVNELEEEKVLNSGRTKIVGLRTRMELAWQKEREEQQRLLQETATLARDLRQTLFEVERERDKERLEAKRKQDQVKKSSEEEQDENKKKITELQYDLLELRDAHAKLRTTNEKLRREKERYEREREEMKNTISGQKKVDIQDEMKVNRIIEQVDTLKQLAPELFFSKENEAPYTPTPPRRTKSKSRETSPALDRRESSLSPEDKQQQIQYVMQRLVHATEDIRKIQTDVDRERVRRMMGARRATSTEHEVGSDYRYRQPQLRKRSENSLKRKSLSLEHTTQAEQKIWTNNDNSKSKMETNKLLPSRISMPVA
ncbi:unnamed protein product [Acanthoscelides obtectus]|uniref:Uncharacterized protein n=1 Tax=Acanthoscelides obtectus TaxID=200917 RepID=A0A9P0KCK8_ACAOB|nr:unnamed protein product [Acanthoscelides obtectus]CAK1628144.1 Protein SOGA3 [Acanthoscelides obtectus]